MAYATDALTRDGVERSGDGVLPPRGPERLARWAMRVPWLWPALLTLAISGYQLGRPLLWRDELYSWTFAVDPVHDTIANTNASNPAQTPYNVFLHYWIAAFGDSATIMRIPSALAMAGTAAIVVLIGRRLVDTRAGLLAGLVFAVVPSVARFGQEVRFYAPEMLVAALSLLVLLRALDGPSRIRWALYGVTVAAAGYLDVVALSMLAGHAGIVALRCLDTRQERDKALRLALGAALAAAAGALACLPVITSSMAKSHGQVGWLVRPGVGVTLFADFYENLFFSAAVASVVVLLAAVAWTLWRPAALMTAMALLPVAAVWLLSQGPNSYFFPRYLQFTIIAWAVLAGIGLTRLDRRIAIAGVALVAVFAASDQLAIRQPGAHDWAGYPNNLNNGYYQDFAGAASYLAHNVQRGDGIVYPSGFWSVSGWQMVGPGVQYYLRHDLPAGLPMPHEEFFRGPSTQFAQLSPHWRATALGSEQRVWVVGAGGGQTSLAEAVFPAQAEVLRQHYRVVHLRHFPGVTVFELIRDK